MKRISHLNLVASAAARVRRAVIVNDLANDAKMQVLAPTNVSVRTKATAAKVDMDAIWVFQSRRMSCLWTPNFSRLRSLLAVKAAQIRARRESGRSQSVSAV
jgi:hypothetical protein